MENFNFPRFIRSLYFKQGIYYFGNFFLGGGLIENIPRVLPPGMGVSLDASLWAMPPVFGWIFGQGNIATSEMARTFNCGIGAVLIVAKDAADSVMDHFKATEEQAWVIGKVTECMENNSSRVVVKNLEDVLDKSAAKAEIKHQDSANKVSNGPVKRPKLNIGQTEQQHHKGQQMKVGVLISGSGTNLQALIDHSLRQDSSAKIVLVISNVPGVQGLKRAETAGIPTKVSVFMKELSDLFPTVFLLCYFQVITCTRGARIFWIG